MNTAGQSASCVSGRRRSNVKARGFSMIELVVVLAIISIVASTAVATLSSLKGRVTFTSAASEVVSGLRLARASAMGRARPTAFMIDTVGGRWWAIEAPTGLTAATFDPAAPGTVIATGTLPRNVTFGPSSGYGKALPAPLTGVPMLSGQSPNFLYCSFCITSGFGMIRFETGAAVTFSGGPNAVGQQFTLTGLSDGVRRTKAVSIVSRTGAAFDFD